MGVNPAVFLANYYLFTYEIEFITTILKEGKLDLAHEFLKIGRYIDDLINIDKKHFENSNTVTRILSVYTQKTLELKKTEAGDKVSFLDVTVYYDKRADKIQTCIYQKREDKKYEKIPMRKYPEHDSSISKIC